MAAPRILLLGFIDRTTDDGAIIMLTSPPGIPIAFTPRRGGPDGWRRGV